MDMDGEDAEKQPDKYRKMGFRRPTRRCTYIIVAVAVLCLILCIVLAVHLSAKSKDYCPKGIHCSWNSMPPSEFLKDGRCDLLCTTPSCMKSAHYALSRIDSSKDPCEDFYEFACGTFVKESVLLPEESEGVFTYQEMENEILLSLKEIIDSVTEKPGRKGFSLMLARKAYDDCMTSDYNEDVLTKNMWKKMFAENGMLPWPLISENATNEPKHLAKMMSSTLFFRTNPFFTVLALDDKSVDHTSRWNFYVREPDLENLKSIYKDPNADDDTNIYVRYHLAIAKILIEIGLNVTEMGNITREVVEFEKVFLKAVTRANKSSEVLYKKNQHLRHETHTHSCQELDHRMRNIKWCRVFRQLLASYGIQESHSIGITIPAIMDYFEEVDKILVRFSNREIINYISLKFIMGHLKYMPSPLRDIYFRDQELFPRTNTLRKLSTRWQQCVDIVSEFLWLPLEREYLRQKFDEEKRAKVLYMVREINQTYLSAIDKMTWLKDAPPGTNPRETIQKITVNIGLSDEVTFGHDTAVDRYFQKALDPNSSGFGNSKSSLMEDVLLLKGLLRKAALSSNREIYILYGVQSFSVFSPYYTKDEMDIHYGMLGFPMFLPGRPMYAEYSTLGSHLFSYMTRLLVIDMSTENSTFEAFSKPISCLKEQSDTYETMKMQFKGNIDDSVSILVQFENALATLGSFQAYRNYLKENGEEKGLPGLPFTNEQLFFISNAQVHCEKFTEKGYENFPKELAVPAKSRVNIPLANSKEFSEAFRCPGGSPMNPKKKCCLLGDGNLSHNCK